MTNIINLSEQEDINDAIVLFNEDDNAFIVSTNNSRIETEAMELVTLMMSTGPKVVYLFVPNFLLDEGTSLVTLFSSFHDNVIVTVSDDVRTNLIAQNCNVSYTTADNIIKAYQEAMQKIQSLKPYDGAEEEFVHYSEQEDTIVQMANLESLPEEEVKDFPF